MQYSIYNYLLIPIGLIAMTYTIFWSIVFLVVYFFNVPETKSVSVANVALLITAICAFVLGKYS